jgi:hypothetical protein
MSEILSKMTREQALGCIITSYRHPENAAFVFDGKLYSVPSDIGLWSNVANARDQWEAEINHHYDDLEKPKWVEPKPIYLQTVTSPKPDRVENFYCFHVADLDAEIARTNARRRIEAFVAANGGGGHWVVFWSYTDSCFKPFHRMIGMGLDIGTIGFVSRELAEAVIERYPAELRLLAGLEEKK